MKQLYLTTVILFFSISLSAQDWKPIAADGEVHFTIEDSGVITNSLVVNFANHNGTDSLYHFNREIAPCVTCADSKNVLLNASNFFGDTMQFNGDGLYHIKRKGYPEYIIDVTKNLGESWQYDDSHTASVTQVTEEDILGETDSIKHITISNGKTFKLSKNHGIIEFPSKLAGKQNKVIGIQNLGLGERVPKLIDFFTYHPGDILEYRTTKYAASGPVVIASGYITRLEILEEAKVDYYSISYKVKKTRVKESYDYNRNPWERTIYSDYKQSISSFYIFSDPDDKSKFVNAAVNSSINFSEEPITWWELAPDLYIHDKLYSKSSLIKLESGKYYKYIGCGSSSIFGMNIDAPRNQVYKKLNDNNEAEELDGSDIDCYNIEYLEGIGMINMGVSGWHFGNNIHLEGAKISGVEYGALSRVPFNTSVETVKDNGINIYPNPATNQVTINVYNYLGRNAEVNIYNASGQIVVSQEHDFTSGDLTLDIANLPLGVYYVKVLSGGGTVTKKLIVN